MTNSQKLLRTLRELSEAPIPKPQPKPGQLPKDYVSAGHL